MVDAISYYPAYPDLEVHARCAFDGVSTGTGCKAYAPHNAKADFLGHDGHVELVPADELNDLYVPKVKKIDNQKQVFSTYLRSMYTPDDPKTTYRF